MKSEPQVRDPEDTWVRSRVVWGGIGLALLGLCLTGLGLVLPRGWLAWGGGAVVLTGLLIAWRGGVMYDTRGQEPPHHEVREVLEGGGHRGVSPQARAVGPGAEAKAAAVTERKKEILAGSMASPPPPLRVLAAFGLIVLGAWLFLDQWFLDYPFTVAGQDNALRDVGFGVVIVLCALRLRLRSPSLLASILVVLTGLLVALSAVIFPHDSALVKWNEVATGLLMVGLAAFTFSRRVPLPDQSRSS